MQKNSYRINAASVIKYLRIRHSLSQAQMAGIIECSIARLSRLESAKLELLSREAMNIVQHFNINAEDFGWGQVTDFATNNEDYARFSIPNQMAEDAHSEGRTLFLHISNFKRFFGNDAFNEFCRSEGINPLYFVNTANPINIKFTLRMFQEMIKKGHIGNSHDLTQYVAKFLNSNIHHKGHLDKYNSNLGLERVKSLIENIETYERNHKYEVLWHNEKNNSIDIRVSLNDHIDKKIYFESPWLNGFPLKQFIPSYFSTFINQPNELSLISQDDNIRGGCVFRYNICK